MLQVHLKLIDYSSPLIHLKHKKKNVKYPQLLQNILLESFWACRYVFTRRYQISRQTRPGYKLSTKSQYGHVKESNLMLVTIKSVERIKVSQEYSSSTIAFRGTNPAPWKVANSVTSWRNANCHLNQAKGHRPLTFRSSLTLSKVCKVRQPVFDQRAWLYSNLYLA